MKLKGFGIAGYARVSTREQAENQYALEQQIARLKDAIARLYPGKEFEIFFDIESGNSAARKQYNRMLNLVEQGKITTIFATRWDRLTRNQLIFLHLKETLRSSNISLQLLDQGEVDFSTASGELFADIQGLLAFHERNMLRERVKKGNEYRRKRRAACGRAPWGYVTLDEKYVLDTKPIVCALEDRPDNYLELYEEADDSPNLPGVSKAQIAREAVDYFLQVRRPRKVLSYLYEKYGARRKSYTNLALTEELLFWNAGQHFADWMKNPVLRGHTAYLKYEGRRLKPVDQWQLHPNTHPDQVLVKESELIEIKDYLKSNTRKVGTPGSKCYLTGLVFCHECGHKCVLKRGTKLSYYGCRHSGTGCDNRKNVRMEKLESAVIAKLFEKANSIESQPEIEQVLFESPKLIKLKEQLAGLEKLLEIQDDDNLKRAKYALEREIESLTNSSEQENFVNATAKNILAYPHAKHLGFWYVLSITEREIVYEKLIKRVNILDGKVVEIELNV
ncbi:MAG: fdxN element excision recombinase XisF [Pleurocapsa sp. MO_226.B13]|nr:fdxN element excision recombinase XisF [Pleurocapsa sp. MO_226.B13]